MSLTPNLTRDQAAARAATVHIDSYLIDLDITDGAGGPGEKTFATRSEIHFDAAEGATTWVDFVGDGIASATLNDRALDIGAWSNTQGLPLTDLAEHNVLVVEALGLYTNTGEGLHRFVDPVDGAVYLYSQFETADAKRLYACFDQPDLKATFTVTVTAPADWQVVSNGATVEITDGPSGSAVHHFAATARMSTYVTALVAGPYHVVRDQHDGIDLGIFCRSTLAKHLDAERIFEQTKQGFDFYHSAFGVRYPFGKYDQLFVPEFNAGAMENAGAVTFREEYVFRSRVTRYLYERRCETILHEMAHMWFGDLVTMRWWDDLWLNESFATWASVVAQVNATEFRNSWTTFANVEKSWAYVQDQLPSTHPIAADIVDLDAVEVNFDGITYAKGASVLKQLGAYVGYEEFLAGLRTYFAEYAYGNATLDDLLRHLAAVSGRDLRTWSAAWLQTTGINRISAEFERGRRWHVHLVRRGAGPRGARWRGVPTTPAGHRPVRRRCRRPTGARAPPGGRRRRCPHGGSRAHRGAPRRAGARQRRRPDLLQAGPGRRLPGHRGDPDRGHRRIAAADACLVGCLGDDQGRFHAGPRLRRTGSARNRGRGRDWCCAKGSHPGCAGGRGLRRPRMGERRGMARGRCTIVAAGPAQRNRAAIGNLHS